MARKMLENPITFRMEIDVNLKVEELSKKLGKTKSDVIRESLNEGLQRLIQESEGLVPKSDTRFTSYRYERAGDRIFQFGVAGDGGEFKLGEFSVEAVYDLVSQFPELLSVAEFSKTLDILAPVIDTIGEKKITQGSRTR